MPKIAYVNATSNRSVDDRWTIKVDYGLKVRPWEEGRWLCETVTVRKDKTTLAAKGSQPPHQLPIGVATEASDDVGDYYIVARAVELTSEDYPAGSTVTVDVSEAPLEGDSQGAKL